MKLTLILAGPYSSCTETRAIWSDACQAQQIDVEIFNLDDEQGENMACQYNLKTFPALIHDHKIIAVGHPSKDDAIKIINDLALQSRE